MLASVAEVRPGERRGAAAAFLTLFGILASHTLLETARDALFLARLPPSQLPWVYLAMAVIAIGISQAPWRVPKKLSGRRSLAVLLVGCSAITAMFWLAGASTHPWALRALYVWTGLLGTLAGLQFWLVLSELYTVTQAKRLYKIVATGALLGAVAGAGLARFVAFHFGAPHIVLASAVVLALTGLGPAMLVRRPAGAVSRDDRGDGPNLVQAIRLVSGNPYVKMLAGLMLVSTVALTLADYVFKSAVAQQIPAEELGRFFANFYMILNLLALAAQTLLMGWLMRVLGLHRTLWVLPAFIFVGSAGVALGGALFAALLLKGADGTLRHSLHRTGMELLFVPLPDVLRARAKPIIDVVGQRGGQAVASLLILAEVSQNRGNGVLAAAAAALCILWVAWASELRRHYLDLFRAALREGSMRSRVGMQAFDLGSLEAVFAGLNSKNDGEVVGAMDILAEEGRVRLIPALILFHPSREVVLRALDHLARSGRADFVPVADRLLGHPDEEIRAAAVRARTAGQRDEGVLRAAAKDSSPFVQATALVGLVAGGWATDEAQVNALLADPAPEARRALARALRQQPVAAFDDLLMRLAESGDAAVQIDVAHALGSRRDPRFLPVLLPMLASRHARPAARAAMVEHGAGGLGFLAEALADETLPHELRRHLPRSISRFPAADAVPALIGRLLDEPDGMVRYKILRGLGRLAAENPDVPVDPAVVTEATRLTLEAAFRLVDWRVTLARGAAEDPRRATPGHEMLATLLRDKEVHTVERLFRFFGLRHRGEDFEKIYRGLRSTSPKVRASSRELLENLIDPAFRAAVVGIIDDVTDVQRLAHAAPFYVPEPLDYEKLLFRLLDQQGETVRCIAAYHVGELGLTAFRERLESFQRAPTGLFVQRVIERALALLSPGKGSNMLDDAAEEAEPRAGGQVERILHLKQLPVIGTLPSSDLALVAERMRERFFKKGEWLLREGEPTKAFYAVLDGTLHVSRGGSTIGHTRAGGVVGGFAILGRDPRGLSVRAEADTLVLEVEADAVFDILEENFTIMHHVLRDIARQLVGIIARQPDPWAHIPITPDPGMARPRELDLVERIFFMRTSSPFKRASINALAELSRGFTEVRAEAGTTLWKAGDPSSFVSMLVSGEVTCTTPGGLPRNLGPGTPLGSIESTAEMPRWYTAVTRTQVTALNGPIDSLIDVFEDNFGMAMDYTALMARWLMDTFEHLKYGDAALARLYGCEVEDAKADAR